MRKAINENNSMDNVNDTDYEDAILNEFEDDSLRSDEEEFGMGRYTVEELEDERRKYRRRKCIFLLILLLLLVVIISVALTTPGKDETRGSPSVSAGSATDVDDPLPPPTLPEKPQVECSSYSNVVVVEDETGLSFCDVVLENDTAYLLSTNVTCGVDKNGPLLSSGTCLDCQGHGIFGTASSSATGNSASGEPRGMYIPPDASGAVVKNCQVSNFEDGVRVSGSDAFIDSTIISENRRYGLYNTGGQNNLLACSVITENLSTGVYITELGDLNVTGSLVARNALDGILFLGSAGEVSCSEVHSNFYNGIMIVNSMTRYIFNSNLHGNTNMNVYFPRGSNRRGNTFMTNVSSCEGGDHDITIDPSNGEAITYTNLMCDSFVHENDEQCNKPCPGGNESSGSPQLGDDGDESLTTSHSDLLLPVVCASMCQGSIGMTEARTLS